MSFRFQSTRDLNINDGEFTSIGTINNYGNTPLGTVFDILEPRIAIHAVYNSAQRESEHASTCQEDTRQTVLSKITAWSTANDGHPVCWLEGPAGSGKSTILHTIAKQCDEQKRLAFSFFFSRGKADRSDAAKVIPTFAYQLAKSIPAIQKPLLRVLTKDNPFAPHLRLHDQSKSLIIDPARSVQRTISPSPMVVVIDGLDECSDENLLLQLIQVLVDVAQCLPFRFLFASRPESHIQQTFQLPLIKPKSYFLSLRDFEARLDVAKYLQQELGNIHRKNRDIMRDVPHPWPSRDQLTAIVEKSEGLFIYVSTLVKYVGDRRQGLPQEKLQVAIRAHHGVDPLYEQVLSEAQASSIHFQQVVGIIIHLHHPLAIHDLAQLLQLSSNHIRQALQGCQSILVLPDSDQESVRPYHASLRDFLLDVNRAKGHFLDPKIFHVTILADCLKLIGLSHENQGGPGYLQEYAWHQWYYHLSSALLHQATISLMNFYNIENLMVKMEKYWLKTWMYGLKKGELSNICKSCELLLGQIAKSQRSQREWKVITESMNNVWKIIKDVCN